MIDETQSDAMQAAFTVMWPLVQRWMTRSELPIFGCINPESSPRVKEFLSGGAAFLITLGLHWQWMTDTNGYHTLILTIPPTIALVHALGSWAGQHIIYNIRKIPDQNDKIIDQNAQLIALAQQHVDAVKSNAPLGPIAVPAKPPISA
jgi:xanthosine utilization system XapX-like protein